MIEPKHPSHADKSMYVGNGYTIIRRLIGCGTNPSVNKTTHYWWARQRHRTTNQRSDRHADRRAQHEPRRTPRAA